MTLKEIEKRQTVENVKFEAAKQIRVLLDEAKKAFVKAGGEAESWEDEEAVIQELVFEE